MVGGVCGYALPQSSVCLEKMYQLACPDCICGSSCLFEDIIPYNVGKNVEWSYCDLSLKW